MISLFGEHFVKAGIFSKDLGRGLNDVYDRRLIGDYGVGLSLNKADAASDLAVARNFVSILKGYLEKQTSGKPRP